MTSKEVSEMIDRSAVVLLPIGTVEGNGPHQVIGFDYLLASELAERVANETESVWLPPIAYGVSESLQGLDGTISVPHETLTRSIEAVAQSLIEQGLDHVVLITSHSQNQFAAESACRSIRRRTGVLIASVSPVPLAIELGRDLLQDTTVLRHGGEPATSLGLHLFPAEMRMDLVTPGQVPEFHGLTPLTTSEIQFRGGRINIYLDMAETSEGGAATNPRGASADRGAQLMARMVEFVADFVRFFRGFDTHQPMPGRSRATGPSDRSYS